MKNFQLQEVPKAWWKTSCMPVFHKHAALVPLLSIRSTCLDEFQELSSFIRLKKSGQSQVQIPGLSRLECIGRVSLLPAENMPED
jgi:hypothetical protein